MRFSQEFDKMYKTVSQPVVIKFLITGHSKNWYVMYS